MGPGIKPLALQTARTGRLHRAKLGATVVGPHTANAPRFVSWKFVGAASKEHTFSVHRFPAQKCVTMRRTLMVTTDGGPSKVVPLKMAVGGQLQGVRHGGRSGEGT